MSNFEKVDLKNASGKILFECYYIESRGICYIQIPTYMDEEMINEKVSIVITGPEYRIGKPELNIKDNGKKMVIKLQLCSRPFIRTTLNNTWLRENVVYEYCEDPEYIKYLSELYPDVMRLSPSGKYNDYVCLTNEGSKIIELKDMWRMSGMQWNLNDESGTVFFEVNYGINYEGDDNCFITIPDNVNQFLIDHDTKIDIVGPIPGSTEPLLRMSMNNDRMQIELMNKYPLDIITTLPEEWKKSHISIDWNPHPYNLLDKYFKDGTLVHVTEELLKSLGISC